jgi:hypothetical protein
MAAQGHEDGAAFAGRAALLAALAVAVVLAVVLGLALLAYAPLLAVVYGGVLAFVALAGLALRW